MGNSTIHHKKGLSGEERVTVITTLARVALFLYIPLLLFLTLYSFKEVELNLPKTLLGIPLDKIVHFLMFLPFPTLVWLSLSPSVKWTRSWFVQLAILLVGLVLASLTEYLQLLTKYRQFELWDLITNYLAIVVGTIVVIIIYLFSRGGRTG